MFEKFREYAELAEIYTLRGESMEAGDAYRLALYSAEALHSLVAVETLIDKIRYAMDSDIERDYVMDLLDLFEEDSGKLK